MDYKQTAQSILQYVGGEKNVSHLEHCSTRLRLTLNDNSKVEQDLLKSVPGVMGVVMTAQCQVVIGNNVIEVYDELVKLGSFSGEDNSPKEKQKIGAVILDFIVGVFQPLIPVIAGGGILKSLLLLLVAIGWMDKTGDTYIVLNNIGEAAFYFLPMFVAVTTARKLKCNQLVAMAAVGVLILPAMTTVIAEGVTIFGFAVSEIAYSSQVFPAILSVLFLSAVEKLITKISPKPIRIFFVPLVSLAVTVPVTLLILGPIGYTFGQWFTNAILFMYDHFGWIAVALLAPVLPFMISTGMHKALVPYAVSSITNVGKEFLYLPASLAHNIAESGACFGVALKTKDSALRSTAISACVSALFGITEPALYGVTIQNKRALAGVMIGSFVGGISIGLFGLAAFAAVGPGVASITMFVDADNSMNLIYAIIGLVISFVVSFVAVLFLWKEDKTKVMPQENLAAAGNDSQKALAEAGDETQKAVAAASDHSQKAFAEAGHSVLTSPLIGNIIPLTQVNDAVFSQKVLGEGIAVNPEQGELYSPADGIVENVFDAKHAIGIKLNNGAELLLHVGLDTVKLEGKHFRPLVKKGNRVNAGDLLMHFDLKQIQEAGYDTIVPIVITNSEEFTITSKESGHVTKDDIIIEMKKKGE